MSNTGGKGPDDCRKICSLRKFVASGFNLSEAVSSIISIVSEVAKVLSNTGLISDEEKEELEQLKAKLQDKEEVNSKPNSMVEISQKLGALWIKIILKQNEIIERKRKILEEQKAELERQRKRLEEQEAELERQRERLEEQETELERQKEEIKRRGKDPLTSLNNRHNFDGTTGELINNFFLYGTRFSVALIDVDDFKRFNTDFGYEMGDFVLKFLAERLSEKFGDKLCFRYGGEEFLVFYEGDISELYEELEAFRVHFSGTNVAKRRKDTPIYIKFSAGVSEFHGGHADLSILINNAEKKLRQAKKTGKNRVLYRYDDKKWWTNLYKLFVPMLYKSLKK